MSKTLREQIKQAFKEAKNPSFRKIAFGSFGWISRLNRLQKQVLGLLDGYIFMSKAEAEECYVSDFAIIKKEKLQELENDVIGYLNDYDIVKFLEDNNVKYDSWLKNQFFKLVGDVRTEIIMKFSKFGEMEKEELTKQ